MSSNNFLQRFKGKTQTVGKEGVHNVLGGNNEDVIVYTNTNFNLQPKPKNNGSLSKNNPTEQFKRQDKNHYKLSSSVENKYPKEAQKRNTPKQPPKAPLPSKQIPKTLNPTNQLKEKKADNPFLVSNPFYLDEQERQRQEKERKERENQEKMERQKEKERQKEGQKQNIDVKKTTHGSLNRSLQKKKNEKQWVKLGGLGANIGGDDWIQKKKKLDKMQQFSEQVKSINAEKPKVPKAGERRQEKKQPTMRQKIIQYSKNVPRPVVRVLQQHTGSPEQKQEATQQLSELQQYELRHEQLKNMLKNQL